MKHLIPLLILISFIYSGKYFSQTTHLVQASDYAFTPSDLTINVGDKVRWINTGGTHNVVADDGSFTSGAVSSDPWVYEHVFTIAGNFRYYCLLHGSPGGLGMSGIIRVKSSTGVSETETAPNNFKLDQNYPNPFNPTTVIGYSIPRLSRITLTIYDISGKEVKKLIDQLKPPGNYEVNFDGRDFPSGVYFYRFQADGFSQTRKLEIIK
jgi:plastocyanin